MIQKKKKKPALLSDRRVAAVMPALWRWGSVGMPPCWRNQPAVRTWDNATCHHATMTPCHYATNPSCHQFTIAPSTNPQCHHATIPSIHLSTNSPCHQITYPTFHQATMQPINNVTNPPNYQSTIKPFHHANSLIHHITNPPTSMNVVASFSLNQPMCRCSLWVAMSVYVLLWWMCLSPS